VGAAAVAGAGDSAGGSVAAGGSAGAVAAGVSGLVSSLASCPLATVLPISSNANGKAYIHLFRSNVASILGTAFHAIALDARETTTVAHFFGVRTSCQRNTEAMVGKLLGCPRAPSTLPSHRFLPKAKGI
jgi:hypothetical protein